MIITMISHIRFWLKKYFFGKSNCFIFEIFQIYKVGVCAEKKIQESDNKIAIYQ